MAKGGLGRGLSSLLGGTFENPAPAAPTPNKERITIDSDVKNNEEMSSKVIPTEQPPRTREPFDRGPLAREDRIAQIIEAQQHVEEPSSVEHPAEDKAKKTDEVDIALVFPNPDQPRTNFKEEDLEELAHSIERDGLLQPILVRPTDDGRYQIIAGERRWQACKKAGVDTVPVRIKEATDDESLELALIENLQRSDLNPIEEAYGYRRLMERRRMTQADVAQAMSKGRSTIANALRLLELPESAQQLLFEEKITAGHARAILSVPTKEGRQALTEKLMEKKLSVRETEALARLMAGREEGASTPRKPAPKSFKRVAKALRESLGTNVRVKSVKGKNKIEIEFKDEEDLERLFEELTAARTAQ